MDDGVLRGANPEIVAPELFRRMTAFERLQIRRAYERAVSTGKGGRRFPTNGGTAEVAQYLFREGVSQAVLFFAIPFSLLFAVGIVAATPIPFYPPGAGELLILVGLALGMQLARIRRWQIRRYFDTQVRS